MSKVLLYGVAGLTLTALVSLAGEASAIQHGCTPPRDIKDITIDVSLGGRTTQARGSFCDSIHQAEAMVARSRVPEKEKKAAYATLAQLQDLVAKEGRDAAGKKVSGSVGCKGTASTGKSGNSASVSCGFQINF